MGTTASSALTWAATVAGMSGAEAGSRKRATRGIIAAMNLVKKGNRLLTCFSLRMRRTFASANEG